MAIYISFPAPGFYNISGMNTYLHAFRLLSFAKQNCLYILQTFNPQTSGMKQGISLTLEISFTEQSRNNQVNERIPSMEVEWDRKEASGNLILDTPTLNRAASIAIWKGRRRS